MVAWKMETFSSKFEDLIYPFDEIDIWVTNGPLAHLYLPQKLMVLSLVMFRYTRVINS
jgi:hypothetical protein